MDTAMSVSAAAKKQVDWISICLLLIVPELGDFFSEWYALKNTQSRARSGMNYESVISIAPDNCLFLAIYSQFYFT
jgi:hypothetical protein